MPKVIKVCTPTDWRVLVVHCLKILAWNIYISETGFNSTLVCSPELSSSGTWLDLENKNFAMQIKFLKCKYKYNKKCHVSN